MKINSRYLLGQWEPRKILAISTYDSTRAKALLAGKARADKKRLVWNLTLALARPARRPRRPRRHSLKSVERNARTMTTVTSALSARAVRLGAPRKVTRRLPSPTPPHRTNRLTVHPPDDVQWLRLARARADAPHARDERLALAADHRHAPPSSSRSPSAARLASPPAPRRTQTRIPRENPPSQRAPAGWCQRRRWAASRSASRRRCPRSPTTAAAAAAGRSASSRSSRWRERRSSPAGGPAEAEVEEATTTIPHRRPGRRIPKTTRKISRSPAASRGRGGNLQSPRDCDAPD